ncbi:MAG: hypothetical protein Q8O66_01340, partial [bacterium]|nr:hypothetical protein [bacterium]
LIVVIAIIAVLAAIVMVNVTKYIAKSKDTAIKGNMHSMAVNAAKFYDSATPTYVGLCTTPGGFKNAYDAIVTTAKTCNGILGSWCACAASVTNPTGLFFCVDQKSQLKETTTNCNTASYCGSASAPVCP